MSDGKIRERTLPLWRPALLHEASATTCKSTSKLPLRMSDDQIRKANDYRSNRTTATPPASLTPTSYVITTLQDYAPTAQGINYLNSATIGFATFGNGTATPLANAANFLNTTIRNNASTEPPKRTFERFMGSTAPVTRLQSPLP